MREQWRDIPDYGGYYQASNLGRIRSVDRVVRGPRGGPKRLKGKVLRSFSSGKMGYHTVNLWKDGIGQTKKVYQLVALTWLGPCPNGQQVRHGPGGCLDNSVDNLSYGTRSQDSLDKRRDGTHGGRPVRRSDGMEFINMAVAMEETGCCYCNIWRVCNDHRKSAGGYGWEYI